MKNCELCQLQARTYCESDQARLCWDCDVKVHAANFLVARHSRTLLCYVCDSLTPWKASGEKLGYTVSVCENCINSQEEESRETDGDENDDDDDDDDEDMELEEEEGENQVVPWSTVTDTLPPVYSSSSSEEVSDSIDVFSLKRRRENASDLSSQNGSSSERKYGEGLLTTQAASVDSMRYLRERGMEPYRSKSAAINVEPLKRFRNQRDEGELFDVNLWESCSRRI